MASEPVRQGAQVLLSVRACLPLVWLKIASLTSPLVPLRPLLGSHEFWESRWAVNPGKVSKLWSRLSWLMLFFDVLPTSSTPNMRSTCFAGVCLENSITCSVALMPQLRVMRPCLENRKSKPPFNPSWVLNFLITSGSNPRFRSLRSAVG